jgi:hypothetical protein
MVHRFAEYIELSIGIIGYETLGSIKSEKSFHLPSFWFWHLKNCHVDLVMKDGGKKPV